MPPCDPGPPPSLDHSGCFCPSYPSAGTPERSWQGPGRRGILGKVGRKNWRLQQIRGLMSLGNKGWGSVPPTHHQPHLYPEAQLQPVRIVYVGPPDSDMARRVAQPWTQCVFTATNMHTSRYTHICVHDQHTRACTCAHKEPCKQTDTSSEIQCHSSLASGTRLLKGESPNSCAGWS